MEVTINTAAYFALAVVFISLAIAGLHAYRTRAKQGAETVMLGIHSIAWQASTGMNILFWVSISTTPVMMIFMSLISFCMDTSKTLLPRGKKYGLVARACVLLFTGMSVMATTNMGEQMSRQADINTAKTEVTLASVTANKNLAESRVNNNYIKPTDRKTLRAIESSISNLQNRFAVNSNGDIAFGGGKKLTVMVATNDCQNGNAFAKLVANQCKRIEQLQKQRQTVADSLEKASDNKAFLSETLNKSKEELNDLEADMNLNSLISKLMVAIGVNEVNASDIGFISLAFGFILALGLESIIIGTLPSRKKEGWKRSAIFYFRLCKMAKKATFDRDKSGSEVGQNCLESVEQLSSAKIAPKTPLVETLATITLDNLEEHINMTLGNKNTTRCQTVREALVFIFQHQDALGNSTIGKNISINKLFDESRAAFGHGNGIRKDAFSEAKEVLFFNGIMEAKAYGKTGKQYCWFDADLMETKRNAVLNGKKIEPFVNEKQTVNDSRNTAENVLQLSLVATA